MINIGRVFILGDSYSTFEGHIPAGYAPYYKNSGPYYAQTVRPEIDVSCVEQTWWHRLLAETESTLVRNCSWSGTTICHTGYDGSDCHKISFSARLDKLIEEGFFAANPVDTLFVFGATNDSWANSPLGEPMYEGWTTADLYNVLPAIGYLTHRLAEALPDTRLIFILNTGLKPEINETVRTACQKNGIEVIELHDIQKEHGHPTIQGMEEIKDQVLAYLA